MEAWVVLGLGVGYLWNRSRKIKEHLASLPDDQELKEAQRPVGENYDSYYTHDLPQSEKSHIEKLKANKDHEIQEFNGGIAEITGEYLAVSPYL